MNIADAGTASNIRRRLKIHEVYVAEYDAYRLRIEFDEDSANPRDAWDRRQHVGS